ncbi:MAG: LPS export ABC transporter periplasmic protein LptC [Verrucomicrobia bacterium]|nr:LPS export ABC transporter periplasmic protein LptC [Verrucomicrobiota bacterium]
MNYLQRLFVVMAATVVVASGWVLQGEAQEESRTEPQSLSKFKVPEYDDDYNLKSQLFGDFAQFREDGLVEITNLKIEFYRAGIVKMEVSAPSCLYNRDSKEAESESSVRIERENLVVTGTGFTWNPKGQTFHILSNAKVVIKDVSSVKREATND